MKHVWNNHESVRLNDGTGKAKALKVSYSGFFFFKRVFAFRNIGDGTSLSLHDLLLWIKELFISRLQTDVMRDSIIKGKY